MYGRYFGIVGLLVVFGSITCQFSNDIPEDIEKKISGIPGLENFNQSALPDLQDVEKIAKEKCDKNGGGEEAFEALKNQKVELQACIEQHINVTKIQAEIDEAKKTGSMDEVFARYCKKYPDIHQCAQNVTSAAKPCLDAEEQDALNKAVQLADELQEFLCFKDGDRIAMFIAEGGVECLQSRKDELQKCANETLGSRIPTEMSLNSMPRFLFTDRDCDDFDKIRECFNTELEKCEDSTPANIIGAFFKFLKKHMPCNDQAGVKTAADLERSKVNNNNNNSASVFVTGSFLLAATILLTKIVQ